MEKKANSLKEEGNVFVRKGRWKEAEECYTRALELNESYLYYSNRGLCYLKLKLFQEALLDFNKSISLNPQYLKSWLRRGNVHKFMKNWTLAKRDFEQVLRLDYKNSQAETDLKLIVKYMRKNEEVKDRKPKTARKVRILPPEDAQINDFKKAEYKQDEEKEEDPNFSTWFHGQIVTGPPGSGKSTYCSGMSRFLEQIGRKVAVINLDPANEELIYEPDIDITELIKLEDVMEHLKLGPNGGLMYCMEYLNMNKSWLREKLNQLDPETYLIFDFPGQAELFVHHKATQELIKTMTESWGHKITCVHLIECRFCLELSDFISLVLLSLSAMLHMELPHVNILSKADLWESFYKEEASLSLDYFSNLPSLERLLEKLPKDSVRKKYRALTRAIAEVVAGFDLVSFLPFNPNDFETVKKVLKTVDKGNGFYFSGKYEIQDG